MSLACLGLYAQGYVSFGNNSTHLVVFNSDTSMLPTAYQSLAGLAVPQLGTAANTMSAFTAQLVYGATASTMTGLYSVAAGQDGFADGRLANKSVQLTGLPGGTAAYFQVRVYETAAGSWSAAQGGTWASGASTVFTVVPGASTPNSIVSTISPAFSTWAAGNIVLSSVPEPSTMALAGLGAALC